MHTKAVFRAAQALSEVGIAALRFNFRGVGLSTGTYDDGIGEQDDVRVALAWIRERYPGLPMIAGGFSFGSMVSMSVGGEDPGVVSLFGLGLPVDLYDFSFLADCQRPTLIVQGDEDTIAPGSRVGEQVVSWGDHVSLVRIPGANHYFDGHFDELRGTIREYFSEGPGARVLV